MNLRELYEALYTNEYETYEAYLESLVDEKLKQTKTLSKDLAEACSKIADLHRQLSKQYSLGFAEGQAVERINS